MFGSTIYLQQVGYFVFYFFKKNNGYPKKQNELDPDEIDREVLDQGDAAFPIDRGGWPWAC